MSVSFDVAFFCKTHHCSTVIIAFDTYLENSSNSKTKDDRYKQMKAPMKVPQFFKVTTILLAYRYVNFLHIAGQHNALQNFRSYP